MKWNNNDWNLEDIGFLVATAGMAVWAAFRKNNQVKKEVDRSLKLLKKSEDNEKED